MYFCSYCSKPMDLLLPCEPVYPLTVVADLLLTNVPALVNLIGNHKHELSPPLYRTVRHRRMRFLPASDVRLLRGFLYSTKRWRKLKLQAQETRVPVQDQSTRP